jgi:hypothetical protein
MRQTSVVLILVAGLVLGAAAGASAQYTPRSANADRSIGETYWVEFSFDFWSPTPAIVISSESLGLAGTAIDFVTDLGIEKTRFRQFDLVLRPAKKHKLRASVTPIRYEAEHVLTRTVVFNGIAYQIGLPVSSQVQWNAWRFGYEYDFIYHQRGFLGLLLEAKYTEIEVNLDSLIGREYTRAAAPVPAIGGIGRVYVARNVGLTFEVSGVGLPKKIAKDIEARYVEYDFYGTGNFSDHIGVRVGYRVLNVNYKIDLDEGDVKLKGPYFGATVRF